MTMVDMEYISKEKVLDIITSKEKDYRNDWGAAGIAQEIKVKIQQEAAADVQPRKYGKWIDCTFYDPCEKSWEQEYEFKCSNCEHKIYNKPSDNNLFCGHCGARMDGDAK